MKLPCLFWVLAIVVFGMTEAAGALAVSVMTETKGARGWQPQRRSRGVWGGASPPRVASGVFPGLKKIFPGLFRVLTRFFRVLAGLNKNFPGFFRVLSFIFEPFPGLATA